MASLISIRSVDRAEAPLRVALPLRFTGGRALGSRHADALLARHPEGVLEARREGAVIGRVTLVRAGRERMQERPSWERIADGGLGRSDDAEGELAWIVAFEAAASLDDAEAARLLARFVDVIAEPSGRSVCVAVLEGDAELVQSALEPTSRVPLPAHFPGGSPRRDGVLLVRHGKRIAKVAQRPERLRVAAIQAELRAEPSREASYARWESLVARAVAAHASIVVLPELLTTEWLVHEGEAVDLHDAIRRVDAHREEFLERFAALAKRHGVTIVAGTHLQLAGDALENVAHVLGPDGARHAQAKLHPTPYEAETFGLVPGRELRVFPLAGIPSAIVTCYDAEFPEVARAARLAGAELLLVPYNTELPAGHHRVRRGASARAMENHVYVVTAGAVGTFTHPFDVEPHAAASAAFGPSDHGFPDDGVLGELPRDVEDVLVVELDFGLLRRTLRGGAVRPYLDR